MLIRAFVHGAELPDLKNLSLVADAFIFKENRAPRSQNNQKGNKQHQRRGQEQKEDRGNNVKDSLVEEVELANFTNAPFRGFGFGLRSCVVRGHRFEGTALA